MKINNNNNNNKNKTFEVILVNKTQCKLNKIKGISNNSNKTFGIKNSSLNIRNSFRNIKYREIQNNNNNNRWVCKIGLIKEKITFLIKDRIINKKNLKNKCILKINNNQVKDNLNYKTTPILKTFRIKTR